MENEPLTLNDVYQMLGERDIMSFRQNSQIDDLIAKLNEANSTITSQQQTITALQKQIAESTAVSASEEEQQQ